MRFAGRSVRTSPSAPSNGRHPDHHIHVHHTENASELLGKHKRGLKPGELIESFLNGAGSIFVAVNEEMAELSNDLGDFSMASPGNAGDRLLLRTESKVLSIRKHKK